MAGRIVVAVAAAAMLLGSTGAAAAPMMAQTGAAVDAPSGTSATSQDRSGRSPASTWLVSVLALLAVVGGIVAAASGDSQPESP